MHELDEPFQIGRVGRRQDAVAEIEEVTDYAAIMQYQVLSTPGLVVNEQLVSAGRIPAEREISAWLTGSPSAG